MLSDFVRALANRTLQQVEGDAVWRAASVASFERRESDELYEVMAKISYTTVRACPLTPKRKGVLVHSRRSFLRRSPCSYR